MNRRKHTKEEFDNFFETYSDYEEYIKANKLENGRVDMAFKYVSNVYMRRCEKNDFFHVVRVFRSGKKGRSKRPFS